jgi:hypothetical protein
MDAVTEPRQSGRWARLLERQRRQRSRLAVLLAIVGLAAVTVALTWEPESERGPAPVRSAGLTEVPETSGPPTEPKPPTTGPGGVGVAPEKTGLPAVPAPGGKVRTGTEEEGCFSDIREYLDQWHRTGVEPDPCFTTQPPSDQEQPDDVVRTYNGERF